MGRDFQHRRNLTFRSPPNYCSTRSPKQQKQTQLLVQATRNNMELVFAPAHYQRTVFKSARNLNNELPNLNMTMALGHCHSSGQERHNVSQLDPVAKGRVLRGKGRGH